MKDTKGSIRDALQTIREGNSIVAEGRSKDMDVDVESIEEAPKPAQMKKLGFYGSEIGGLRQGNKYYVAKPVDVKGKVGFRVTDEFGSFETIDLKTFAKRFG